MSNHILLVEDDNDLRDMIARTLRKAGYDITEAPDGQHAIDLLTSNHTQRNSYHVVLTDIVMGMIDGIEVLNVARSLPNPPEVILLTGHGSLQTAIEAVRNNAFDYLLKPSPKARLLERIAAALDHYQQRQRQHKAVEIVRSLADFATHSTHSAPVSAPHAESLPAPDSQNEADRYRQVGKLRLDTYRQEAHFANEPMHVTPTEYLILACLAASPGRVISFGDIVRHTHSYDVGEAEAHNLLRTHIRNLRKKFDRRYIESVYATGYMLVEPEEEEAPEPQTMARERGAT
jgi:two-component system, OmpR family, response regulator